MGHADSRKKNVAFHNRVIGNSRFRHALESLAPELIVFRGQLNALLVVFDPLDAVHDNVRAKSIGEAPCVSQSAAGIYACGL